MFIIFLTGWFLNSSPCSFCQHTRYEHVPGSGVNICTISHWETTKPAVYFRISH